MRRFIIIGLVLLAAALPSFSQSGFTTVSATPIKDPTGKPYVNCSGNASFVPSPTATQQALISGSTFQTQVPIAACDSFGNMSIVLVDNSLITDGHTGAQASQWRVSVASQDGKTAFSCFISTSGNTQNITAAMQACAAPLPSSGGGSGAFSYTTLTSTPTPVFNAATNTGYSFTLTSNAVATFGTPNAGTIYQLNLCENGTGGFTFTFPGNVVLPPGFNFNTSANACNQLAFIYDGTNWQPWSGAGTSPAQPTNSLQKSTAGGALAASGEVDDGTTLTVDRDQRNKGPNPWFDITRYGGYANTSPPTITCATTATLNTMSCGGGVSDFLVGHGVTIPLAGPASTLTAPGLAVPLTNLSITANIGTLTAGSTAFAPASSVTISGATDGTLNGNFTVVAGTNNQISITHANCSPCSVGGSATIVAAVPGAVTNVGILNGTTNYSYKAVSVDKNGGLSPASAAFTTTTGSATLGVAGTATLSSCNRTSGLVTCTTNAAHNFQAGVPVNIPRGSGDPAFEGQFTIVATPLSTTFTFYQAGQEDHTGTVTPGAVIPKVIAKNVVKWVMQPYAQYQAVIYRCTGAACSNYAPVAMVAGMDSAFEDWGLSAPPIPAYIPATPPASTVNAPLTTTITAVNGTTVTLGTPAIASVGSATVFHDNGPNLLSACGAGVGTMYLPVGLQFPFNSILDTSPCQNSKIIIAGSVKLSEPWLMQQNLTIEGYPASCPPSSASERCAVVTGSAQPLFLFTPGKAGGNVVSHIDTQCFQNYQSCLFYDQDNNGNNVSQQTWHSLYVTGGNGELIKTGGAFSYFWDDGVMFNQQAFAWGSPPIFTSRYNFGFGNIAQQLLSDLQVRNVTLGDGEWVWDDKGGTSVGAGIIGNNYFKYLVNESSFYPQFRFNVASSQVILANWTLDTQQYADPLGGQAVAIIDLTNVTAGRVSSFSVLGQGCSGGNQPVFEMAPGAGGVFFTGNTVSCRVIGSDTFILRTPTLDTYNNSNINLVGTSQLGYTLAAIGTPAVSNVAGTLAVGTYFYRVIPVDINLNPGPSASPVSASCTSNGSQACVVTFTPVAGQTSSILCRGPSAGNTPCAIVGTAHNFSGASFTDNLASGNFSNSTNFAVGNGSGTSISTNGLATSNLLIAGGTFVDTITGTFTAARSNTLEDATGALANRNFAGSFTQKQTFSNALSTTFADFPTSASPGNPAAGNIRVYGDTGSGNLTCLTSAGASCIPSGGAGTPGGSSTQVQFNNSGAFAGSVNLTYVSPALSIGSAAGATGQIKYVGTTSGTVTTQSQDVAGTWTFKWPTTAGTSNFPLVTDGTGVSTWSLLGLSGGGTGTSSFAANQLLTGNGASAIQSVAGSTTGVNPVLKLQPALAANTALILDTAVAPSGDILDFNINGVKTSWFDNAAILHTPSTTFAGSGPLSLSGSAGTLPSCGAGQYILTLADSGTNTAQLCNNGNGFKPIAQVNGTPTGHGLALFSTTSPQLNSTSAGTAGNTFISGGAGADGAFGQLDLANANSHTGILNPAGGGTGATSLLLANIMVGSGAFVLGDCLKSGGSNIVVDQGAVCGGAGGSPALNTVTAAAASNTINSTVNPQTWNWALTGSTTAFKFGENTAATGANNIILQATTVATSTAVPFQADNNGNGYRLGSTGLFQPLGTGALATPGAAHNLVVSQAGSAAVTYIPPVTAGKVLIDNGPGVDPSFQDPIVSFAFVNLWTAQDVTTTRTSAAVRNPLFSQTGTLQLTWASITGSPATCTLQIQGVDSQGNVLNNGSTFAVSPANGTTSQTFTAAASLQTAAQIKAIFACVTYPSTGTLTLDYTPIPNVNVTNSVSTTPPANASTNVTQFGGVAVSTGTGASGTGIPRVTISNDSSLAANQSTNESQINGVTPLMNNGASGTGSQRINVANDNSAIANWGQGATGSAVPANAVLEGMKDTAGNMRAPLSDLNGRQFSLPYPDTTTTSYHASKKFAASSTTDVAVFPGNATNTAILTKVTVSCTQTTAGVVNLELLKRSTADTAGTSAAMTAIPDDANYAAAVSAPLSYTGTGPTVGTPIGDLDNYQLGCNASATAGPNDIYVFKPAKPIVLRGVAQMVTINFGGAITGGNITVTWDWDETTTP